MRHKNPCCCEGQKNEKAKYTQIYTKRPEFIIRDRWSRAAARKAACTPET
ncbi:hypothetical protein HMPREF9098_2431 [Kingella denitrificans ATCC 33394]|uniref:Uncharacterized protein n=1 Tax=Kingella denitrificans ATCC 33394 TaxID=888741 RepID=F0F2U6_9NEIS|nr:hypothetical protein HMPREF9098_2431 [Kingella denitrificans ATCC 33394]